MYTTIIRCHVDELLGCTSLVTNCCAIQYFAVHYWLPPPQYPILSRVSSVFKSFFVLFQQFRQPWGIMAEELKPVNEEDFKLLKERMKLIADADPTQYHNDFSLRRYLRAFKTVDSSFQAILKTNKWRVDYGVADLENNKECIEKYSNKARVLRHRDIHGRPIVYIPARNHSSNDRDIDDLTKFIVYCLEEASKKCFEEVVDNLCIVFDLNNFTLSCMDYQVLKNLIWLLSRHYPERLGVCLIINAPAFFSGCWAVIKGWLDENTAGKVTFVNSEMDLCNYLIPDIMPTDM